MKSMSIIEQLENGTSTDKIIEIKSAYKNGKTTVQPVKDPLNGWYKGLPRLSDEDKKKLNFWAEPSSTFKLYDGVTFDLNNPDQKIIWDWVKFQPCLATSKDAMQHKPNAEFYIHLKNKEAKERISGKLLKHKAVEYVINDEVANYPMRAKLLGMPMDGEDPIAIKDFLLDRAESHASQVVKIYEDKFISLRMLLLNAIDKHIISIEKTGAYRYGTSYIGMTENTAVEWLNDSYNKTLVAQLEREVNPSYFEDKEKTDSFKELPQLER